MAPLEQTGKQKASRIPLDFHKRPDFLARGRYWLTILALASIGVYSYFALRNSADAVAPGPVASVHTIWEHHCDACHEPFAAIRADAVTLWGQTGSVTDDRCQACHPGAKHYVDEKPGEMGRCSSCHSEHLGPHASITRTDDHSCVRCHEDLRLHASRPEALIASGPYENVRVTAFSPGNHPQFRSAASDPGKLKFSHRRHLATGLNLGGKDRFLARRLKDLAPEDRDRYRVAGQQDDDLIRLDCAACHRLQSVPSTSGSGHDRRPAIQPSTGAYMLSIQYKDDCQACHRLNYEPASSKSSQVLPHGLQPAEIERYLQAVYTQRYLDSNDAFAKTPLADDRLPGKPEPAESPAAKTAILEQVNRADTYLRGRCQECHELAGLPTKVAIEPTRVPSLWLAHARFDHSAHRAVDCRVCHAQDYLRPSSTSGTGWPSLDNQDVLLPKIDVCFHCHAPRTEAGTGGARFDCVECHVYHAADEPHAARSRAAQRWQLNEFLRGRKPAKAP